MIDAPWPMLALATALVGAAQPDAPLTTVRPAAYARMIEAYAAADIQKGKPTAIVPVSARQLSDPAFRPLANQLAELLIAQGFDIVAPPQPFTQAVTLEYKVYSDTHQDLPGSGSSDPSAVVYGGPARFPAYRRITVTAYDLSKRPFARVLWRTAMDDDGFDDDVRRTIPPLVSAGAKYYGARMTALAVADCDDFSSPLGSHVSRRPCAPLQRMMATLRLQKRPQVIIETPVQDGAPTIGPSVPPPGAATSTKGAGGVTPAASPPSAPAPGRSASAPSG